MKRLLRAAVKSVVVLAVIAVPVVLVLILKANGAKKAPYVPPRRANVEVVTVQRDTLDDVVVLPAAVETLEDGFVSISTEIAGCVVSIEKKEGEAVKAGDVLLRIDTERLEAELTDAKASYTEAKQKYERTNQLYEGGHVSKDQLESARAALDRAAAKVTVAEVALKKGTVTSGISGTVDRRYVDQGEYVLPGTKVFDVINVEKLYAVVDVPERDRQYVNAGLTVSLAFENVVLANPGHPLTVDAAVVKSVSDMGNNVTRTYRAKAEFDNPQGMVKPGMLGTARIRRRSIPNLVVVPKDFIVASESERLVYVAVEGKAIARRVELGFTDGNRFLVLKGLEAGEQIIREPRQLTPGQPIRVLSVDGRPTAEKPGVPLWSPATVVDEMKRRATAHEAQ